MEATDGDVLQQVVENVTEAAKNATTKTPATPEGMAVAYGSLVLMALLPIFYGSFRSVTYHKAQKESGEVPDTMSHRDAAMFPLFASAALFGLYIFFQVFSKEYINMLLTSYFFVLGILAMTHMLSPIVENLLPSRIPRANFRLLLTKNPSSDAKDDLWEYTFNTVTIVCLGISSVIGVWYLLQKHWVANNVFGLAFAVNGVELLHLNSIITGCILLGGLFIYDVFWVFGTNVMVTVAKSFEAPIKLVFPQDILERGLGATNFAMLGLGDIVIPGIFIALLLRFDTSLKRGSNTYFNFTFLAYFLGLLATIFVMHVFKHAQPALLYLVPACVGTPLLLGLIKGDLNLLFQYEDHPEKQEEDNKED
ncbi:unnamed protein product [Darwinula stevensoni]|uniref:Minor histocompatibility antigen H13 n=1 Tax=Darwinula stevensoni TaxID=69355 RepID=A0A7R8WYP5_9CRUS|nr:unnamed protein product [Darwinula stevensoni]CAG0879628.1 unnamed protein product [Darwinula stevensoni]